eukprot:jgi/Ulvmu1/2297/UM013_0144.1
MGSTKAERRALQDAQRSSKAAAGMENPARVIFVRHGETNWNLEGRMQGQMADGDVPVLTELGTTQAHAVAAYLKEHYQHASCIYSSDLKRAMQTAEAIQSHLPALEIHSVAAARERHLGLLHGVLISEAAHAAPAAHAALRTGAADEPIPGGGESEKEFYGRAVKFLDHLAQTERGNTVIVVTHGGFLAMAYRACTGRGPGTLFQNCAIGELLLQPGAAAMLRWDVAVHAASVGAVSGGGRFG